MAASRICLKGLMIKSMIPLTTKFIKSIKSQIIIITLTKNTIDLLRHINSL
jgi:hypothetical protein